MHRRLAVVLGVSRHLAHLNLLHYCCCVSSLVLKSLNHSEVVLVICVFLRQTKDVGVVSVRSLSLVVGSWLLVVLVIFLLLSYKLSSDVRLVSIIHLISG